MLAMAFAALAAPAHAQMVRTLRHADLRAGPGDVFPLVMGVPARDLVSVAGCTPPPVWCDIVVGRQRGFVPADALPQAFSNRPPPVVTFSLRDYWSAHYSRRPWYGQVDAWAQWGTPSFAPPPQRSSR